MKMTYKQHNDELHDLWYSRNTIRLKLVVGHVARVGEKTIHTEFSWGNQKEETPSHIKA